MPIFDDSLRQESPPRDVNTQPVAAEPIPIAAPLVEPSLARRLSEESIRTELCDGPLPDSPKPRTPETDFSAVTSDRAELIERLKRGESPTWIPNRHLEALYRNGSLSPSESPRPRSRGSPTLLPPATIASDKAEETKTEETEAEERLQDGLNIERPGSALHSGDFTQNDRSAKEKEGSREARQEQSKGKLQPARHSWLATSPPRDFTPFHFERRTPFPSRSDELDRGISSLSSSLSSSFVYKAPTSPLVQSETNDEFDLPLPMNNLDIATSNPRSARRHTLNFSHPTSLFPQRTPSLRRDGTYPYQAHQPRRSLTSTPNLSLPGPSPQTPAWLRSRRPSLGSDTSPSPLQHASMVGSYEESILRGRMSTTPSKPLDFLAQIGVLGLGNCKPSLRCPSHVTLPFSAVFYSYGSTPHGRSSNSDGPSPYVGQIDLENGLPNPEGEARAKRKQHNRYADRRVPEEDIDMTGVVGEISELDTRRSKRQKRRSSSPKAPPGGSYRIPEKGQLQIIIKNQNKTAVKLFLVPYDLAGMESGTKTFIRQRSYSAGPIIENMPALQDPGADRPILRYLVHLHICCPSRGRYYLYKSIRVVFANRVPDGKEKLRNEVSFPEPRYSAYKPIRVMHPPMTQTAGGPGAILAAEKAYRRRSSGFSFGHYPNHGFDPTEPLPSQSLHAGSASRQVSTPFPFTGIGTVPIEPIPFRLTGGARTPSDVSVSAQGDTRAMPITQFRSLEASSPSLPSQQQQQQQQASDPLVARYDKLSRGDVGYGGNAFAAATHGSPGAAEGLLSQRLRSLGVRGRAGADDGDDGQLDEDI